jgi:hypothetical protein
VNGEVIISNLNGDINREVEVRILSDEPNLSAASSLRLPIDSVRVSTPRNGQYSLVRLSPGAEAYDTSVGDAVEAALTMIVAGFKESYPPAETNAFRSDSAHKEPRRITLKKI